MWPQLASSGLGPLAFRYGGIPPHLSVTEPLAVRAFTRSVARSHSGLVWRPVAPRLLPRHVHDGVGIHAADLPPAFVGGCRLVFDDHAEVPRASQYVIHATSKHPR